MGRNGMRWEVEQEIESIWKVDSLLDVYIKWESGHLIKGLKLLGNSCLSDLRKLLEAHFEEAGSKHAAQQFTFLLLRRELPPTPRRSCVRFASAGPRRFTAMLPSLLRSSPSAGCRCRYYLWECAPAARGRGRRGGDTGDTGEGEWGEAGREEAGRAKRVEYMQKSV
ncbi:hypothetical protein GUJ93_ZPchr0001g31993 [Zizania palustris]|uniref:Uncharacterized protein n=1 Tax=Zizania palustris TaxID=103762 RepID=A0A8J5SG64_ZIZPA|nr:hypothetical protein GUJ93_ZPchr0001g31993 [Zizania palustris]